MVLSWIWTLDSTVCGGRKPNRAAAPERSGFWIHRGVGTKEQVCKTSRCCVRCLSVPAAGALNLTVAGNGAGCPLSGTLTAGGGREENYLPDFDATSAPHGLGSSPASGSPFLPSAWIAYCSPELALHERWSEYGLKSLISQSERHVRSLTSASLNPLHRFLWCIQRGSLWTVALQQSSTSKIIFPSRGENLSAQKVALQLYLFFGERKEKTPQPLGVLSI